MSSPVERLKLLERKARSSDIALDELATYMALIAHEFLNLWQSVQTDRDNHEYEENMHLTDKALAALSTMAAEVLGVE